MTAQTTDLFEQRLRHKDAAPPPWLASDHRPEDVLETTPTKDGKERIRVNPVKLAWAVNPHGDLALGTDHLIWRYDAGRYRPDDEAITRRVVQVMRNRYSVTQPRLARDVVVHTDGFPVLSDAPPDSAYINVRNGMFHWPTGQLLPHSPRHRSTVQLPVAWDENAICPNFDRWLESVVDDEHINIMWQVIAYTTLFGNPLQVAALLYGPPRGGKSTLIRVLERVIGHENTANVTVQGMASRFEPAQLYGKLANVVADLEATYLPDTAAFKRIVSGDRIYAEHKGVPGFSFEPWAFHIFAANKLPPTSDPSGGWLRRWVIVPFKGSVTPDPDFAEASLYAEAPGIFAKAVNVLPSLMLARRFDQTQAMKDVLTDLAEQSNNVLEWLANDENILEKEPKDDTLRIPSKDAFAAYKRWAIENEHRPCSAKTFADRLGQAGYALKKVNGNRQIAGLSVRSSTMPSSWGSE